MVLTRHFLHVSYLGDNGCLPLKQPTRVEVLSTTINYEIWHSGCTTRYKAYPNQQNKQKRVGNCVASNRSPYFSNANHYFLDFTTWIFGVPMYMWLYQQTNTHVPWYELGSYFRFCLTVAGDKPTPAELAPTSRTTLTELANPEEVGGGAGSTGWPRYLVALGLGMPVFGFNPKDSWIGSRLLPDGWVFSLRSVVDAVDCKAKQQ